MNIDYIKSELSKSGWKNLNNGPYMEIDFDLVGSRRFTLTKWNVLVKRISQLNQDAVSEWQQNFETISKKSKSFIWGKCFLICLLAEEVSEDLLKSLSSDSFGLFGVLRLKGGGGNILIADLKNKQTFGKVPSLPYDVRKFSKSVKNILTAAMNN